MHQHQGFCWDFSNGLPNEYTQEWLLKPKKTVKPKPFWVDLSGFSVFLEAQACQRGPQLSKNL
jgi:hypothetical protein